MLPGSTRRAVRPRVTFSGRLRLAAGDVELDMEGSKWREVKERDVGGKIIIE